MNDTPLYELMFRHYAQWAENATEEDLRTEIKRCKALTPTNCWWGSYNIAHEWLIQLLEADLDRLKYVGRTY